MSLDRQSMLRLVCSTLSVVWIAAGAWATQVKDLSNALPNSSFEHQMDGKPVGWSTGRWSGEGTFVYADMGRTGKHSLVISSGAGADIGWHTTVDVEPHSTYRLSAWIKTENVELVEGRGGRGALLNLHNIQPLATPAVTGTHDWTRVELVFDTAGNDAVQVNCLFGGWGLAKGKAWYDDVLLERLSSEDWKPEIVIDVAPKGQPISKYIYGQFIEHLGRCIYGGIWAEMLEDRKFYFPITPDYAPYGTGRNANAPLPVVTASPWQIVGAADAVRMETERPFVGDHTPWVKDNGGIRQNDLAVVKGKNYQGYLWAKSAGEHAGTLTVTLGGPDAGGPAAVAPTKN